MAVAGDLRPQETFHEGLLGRQVVGMCDLGTAAADQFRLRIAEHRADRRVRIDQPTIQGDLHDSDRRLFEQQTETFVCELVIDACGRRRLWRAARA